MDNQISETNTSAACSQHGMDYRALCTECEERLAFVNRTVRENVIKNETEANISRFTRNEGKNPNCPKCHGKGNYMYDEIHGTICDLCCEHDLGWWKLDKRHYGRDGGKFCCFAGCGVVKDRLSSDEKEVETENGSTV